MSLKEPYKSIEPYLLVSMIFGGISNYYAIQMSGKSFKDIKNFDQDSDKVLDYTSEMIANIIWDALCE